METYVSESGTAKTSSRLIRKIQDLSRWTRGQSHMEQVSTEQFVKKILCVLYRKDFFFFGSILSQHQNVLSPKDLDTKMLNISATKCSSLHNEENFVTKI